LVIRKDVTQGNAGRFVEDKANDQTFSHPNGRREPQNDGFFENRLP